MQSKHAPAALRRFGFTMAGAFGLFGAYFWWKGAAAWPFLFGLAAAFALTAIASPGLLKPIEIAWMALAEKMSIVMTFVILTLVYFVVITPLALLLRLMRKDLLSLRPNDGKSYWKKIDPDGPGNRPKKPF